MGTLIKAMAVALAALGLSACSSSSPEDALNEAASRLQKNLENRQAGAASGQLHTGFLAQQRYDRQAAHQRMLGLFLRYRNVNILVINRQCRLDRDYRDVGHCTAQVAITGAQGLIPERLDHHRVSSQWQWQDKEWQLLRLDWN